MDWAYNVDRIHTNRGKKISIIHMKHRDRDKRKKEAYIYQDLERASPRWMLDCVTN